MRTKSVVVLQMSPKNKFNLVYCECSTRAYDNVEASKLQLFSQTLFLFNCV